MVDLSIVMLVYQRVAMDKMAMAYGLFGDRHGRMANSSATPMPWNTALTGSGFSLNPYRSRTGPVRLFFDGSFKYLLGFLARDHPS